MLVVGDHLEFTSHPNKYTGKVTDVDPLQGDFEITWDRTDLIPPSDRYSFACYLHGDFNKIVVLQAGIDSINTTIEIDGGRVFCNHEWKKYHGFTEVYDYCIHCDEKRK